MTIRFGFNPRLAVALALVAAPALAHHSFAIYNNEVTKVFTGVVTRVNPDANHLQVFFAPMNADRTNVERGPDGKPIIWAVEMAGSAQAATDGISVASFPPGTIFSVGMHPLRSGENAGAREGGLFSCPAKTPPAAGQHCDSVQGGKPHGAGKLADAKN
ncbi:MAG: hypothetical protein LBE59_06900 [Nevskiaceae bacterium]|jgi:hypothetical protein|nr:hypothetical protein [Nevskiaceae bacterium]